MAECQNIYPGALNKYSAKSSNAFQKRHGVERRVKMTDAPLYFILDSKVQQSADSALEWLGRIVKNYREPDHDFTPDDPRPFIGKNVSANIISNVVIQAKAHQSQSLMAALTRIASASSATQNQRQIDFGASSIISVRLQKHPEIFRALRQDEVVRGKLKEMMPPMSKPAYMIVALLIWTDAAFVEQVSTRASQNADITFPLMSILAAAGASSPTDLGDPRVKATKSSEGSAVASGFSPGSRIFAFEYKTVRRSVRSVMSSFTPRMESYGPRVQGDLVFHGSAEEARAKVEAEKQLKDQAVTFEIEKDHLIWTESIEDEERPAEVEGDDIAFALDEVQSSPGTANMA